MAEVLVRRPIPDQKPEDDADVGFVWDTTTEVIVGLYGHNNTADRLTVDIGVGRSIIIPPGTAVRQRVNIPAAQRPSFRTATRADHPWQQQHGFVPGFDYTVWREYTNPRRGSPTVSASGYTEFFGGSTTSHDVPMPSTVDANDLLHVVFLNTGTATVTASGFTDKGTATNTDRHSVFAKVAVGDEDSTNVDFVTSSGAFAIAHVRRIDDGSWLEDIDGVEVELATGTSATPDPPANTPSWGSSDTGWVAAGTKVSGTVTGAPTSYTDFVNGSAGDNMGSAFRANTTATENPGTFGGSTSSAYVASTTAIASDSATLPSSDVGNIASTALSGTSTSVTIPSHDSGDQLVMVLRVTASVTPMEDFPTITGWTEVSHGGVSGNAEAGNFSAVRVGIFEKTGNGSESSVTVGTWSNSIGGRATVFQLTNRGDIKDVVIVESDSNADIDIGAGSTDEDDTIAIWGFMADDDLSTEADHDSDASWQGTSVDYAEASTPGNGYATACAYVEDISSGTIPASTFSMNGDTDAGVAVMVAFGPDAGGTPGTATPGVISTSTVFNAPTGVGQAQTSPSAFSPTVTLNAPTVTGQAQTAPPTVVPPVVFNSPTVSGEAQTNPAAITPTVVLNTPTPQVPAATTPSTINPAVTLNTPTVAGQATAQPSDINTTTVFYTPTFVIPASVATTPITTTVVFNSPTVSGEAAANPSLLSAAATLNTPAGVGQAQTSPATTAMTVTLNTPSVTGQAAASPAASALSVVFYDPSVTGGAQAVANPDTVATSVVLHTPTVSGPGDTGPSRFDMTAVFYDPDTSGQASAAPNRTTMTVVFGAPTVSGDAAAVPSRVDLAVAMLAASGIGQAATATTPIMLSATFYDPDVTGGGAPAVPGTATPDTIQLDVFLHLPEVTGDETTYTFKALPVEGGGGGVGTHGQVTRPARRGVKASPNTGGTSRPF